MSIVIIESTRSVCGEETPREVLAFILETFVQNEFAKDLVSLACSCGMLLFLNF